MFEDALNEVIHPLEIFLEQSVNLVLIDSPQINSLKNLLPPYWFECFTSGDSTKKIVRQIWQSDGIRSHEFIEALATRTFFLAVITSTDLTTIVGLCYGLKHDLASEEVLYEAWVGGLPITLETIKLWESKHNSKIPNSYTQFCQIHNGFLKDGNTANGFVPLDELEINDHFLTCFHDGLGNSRVYDLRDLSQNDMVLDWDHETHDYGDPRPFWEFVNDCMLTELG